MAKQIHTFTLKFDVETEDTDPDMVDMTELINAARALLVRAQRKPHNHIEIFDHVESREEE